jgi:FG-GAP repeat protein
MSDFAARGLMCVAMTLTALTSLPALGDLPEHRRVAVLKPTSVEAACCIDEDDRPNSPGFGSAVAIRDGIAFVGIPKARPNAHVAVYAQTTTGWKRTATLSVSDPLIPDGITTNGFGKVIAFRDGVAVIASASLLHVFTRNNGVWTDIQQIPPPPKDGPLKFWEISTMRYENGILAIGSPSFSGPSVAYIYERASNGKFGMRATLRASGSFPGDLFGGDVGVAGNTVVVGGGQHNAAFVFKRKSDGTWVRTQKLVGADSSPVDSFGAAVAIDRDLILVGAPFHDCYAGSVGQFCSPGTSADPSAAGGAAYGFVRVGGQYVQVFKLRPRSDESFNYWNFGRRISMSDRHVAIDAGVQSFAGDPDIFDFSPGLTFTYSRDGSTLTARGLASGYIEQDSSMALFNRWLVIGSTLDLSVQCTSSLDCFGFVQIRDLSQFAP